MNRPPHRRVIAALALVALTALSAGCSRQPPWRTKDVTGVVAPLEFHLTDDRGRAVDAADYRGKVVLLFFGYLNCPDVCPTTMVRLQQARHLLGEDAAETRLLFVSVDPGRDDVAALRDYAAAFGDGVVALRAGDNELRRVTKRYRVTYGYGKPDAQGFYLVSHSSAVFVFDRDGRARLLATSSDTAEAIGADLARLVAESG